MNLIDDMIKNLATSNNSNKYQEIIKLAANYMNVDTVSTSDNTTDSLKLLENIGKYKKEIDMLKKMNDAANTTISTLRGELSNKEEKIFQLDTQNNDLKGTIKDRERAIKVHLDTIEQFKAEHKDRSTKLPDKTITLSANDFKIILDHIHHIYDDYEYTVNRVNNMIRDIDVIKLKYNLYNQIKV